jgi:hypothetical protein
MSAPKRTNASSPNPTVSDDRSKWLATFLTNVRRDGTASRAWEMLESAGLEKAALRALWTYAHPPHVYMKREHRKVRRINSMVKALIRSDKIDRERHEAGDPRANMFSERHRQKYDDLVRSEMPFADDGSRVAHWMLARVEAGKGIPDLPASREAFVSLGPRSPISNRKFWLFVLLCFAENAGIPLGLGAPHCSGLQRRPSFQV